MGLRNEIADLWAHIDALHKRVDELETKAAPTKRTATKAKPLTATKDEA